MAIKTGKTVFFIGICLLFILALFIRFWHFSINPPSLDWDEVSFGYNAYSILKTGRDEFGTYLPRYIRSLDDYKMPLYTYLTAGSIALFGYNDFAVRFFSGIFGLGTVIVLYFLVQELTNRSTIVRQKVSAQPPRVLIMFRLIAILSSLLLAIVPWHVQFSRFASEANSALFFLVCGVTIFLYAIRKRVWVLPLSIIIFALSAYTYRSEEVIVPLLIIVLINLCWNEIKRITNKTPVIIAGTLFTLLILLIASDAISPIVNLRVKGTSVFDTGETNAILLANGTERLLDISQGKEIISKIFHSYHFSIAQIIIKGYLVHFSPTFLFTEYSQRLYHTPFVALLYLWMIFFIPIGIYYIIQHYPKSISRFIFFWLFISPIPASVTRDVPQPARVLPMLIPIIIFVASVIISVYENISKKYIVRYSYIAIVILCIVFSSIKYFHQYSTHLPYERSEDWIYGRKELVDYVETNKAKYNNIIISTRLEWPHIFFLYYSKYDPAAYLRQGATVSGGWGEQRNRYDSYEFRAINRSTDFRNLNVNNILYAGLPDEFPEKIKPLYIIRYLNGKPAIWIVDKTSFL